MTNQVYPKYREAAWVGKADVSTNPVVFFLVDGNDYTPNMLTDEFLSAVPESAIVSTSAALEDVTAPLGLLTSPTAASGIKFEAATGDISELVIGVQSTGSRATSRLIVKIDTAGGLAVTPNTSDIFVIFPDGQICNL